jgi:hypothetical protein
MLFASCPVSELLLDSMSKNTNVFVPLAIVSPAPAPPPNTLTLMLNTQLMFAYDTGSMTTAPTK